MLALRRLSPLLLLAAALAALAVLLVHDSRPAAADHFNETAWSATLTVRAHGGGGVLSGCNNDNSGAECSATSNLTDDGFTFDGVSYEVIGVSQLTGDTTLKLSLNKAFPDRLKWTFSLYVDGTAHSLSGATFNTSGTTATIATGSLSWTAGDTVTLELKTSPVPPSGVELTGGDLDTSDGEGHFHLAITEGASGTFTVALTNDPGGTATVSLVRTDNSQSNADDHVWDWSAATLSPATLTFTSSNYSTPQTVTVSGAEDDDTCNEQLVILVLSPTEVYDYVYVGEGNGDYNRDANGNYVYAGSGAGEYSYQAVSSYGPVGGTSNSATGVYVTVADDDSGQGCGGV